MDLWTHLAQHPADNAVFNAAGVFVVDGATGDQVTPGQQFAPASATMRISYTIPPAPCAHLLVVWVRDIAGNRLLGTRIYSPCPPPPPVFTS